MTALEKKFNTYYLTAIFSLIFAVTGFTYNAWRMEVSEDNNNIRTAAFEVLTELAELEQLIYSAHYDQNPVEGNPRKGWVKIGLVVDLSTLISEPVTIKSLQLKEVWANNWANLPNDRSASDSLIASIDTVRLSIKHTLSNLE